MAFHGIHRPLEDYTGALRGAGLIEDLREPAPTDEDVAACRRPRQGAGAARPFLHWLALRP